MKNPNLKNTPNNNKKHPEDFFKKSKKMHPFQTRKNWAHPSYWTQNHLSQNLVALDWHWRGVQRATVLDKQQSHPGSTLEPAMHKHCGGERKWGREKKNKKRPESTQYCLWSCMCLWNMQDCFLSSLKEHLSQHLEVLQWRQKYRS